MYAPRLPRIGTYAAWRETARRLARADVPAAQVDWGLAGDDASMFDAPLPIGPLSVERGDLKVPASFADLSRSLIPERSGKGMTLAYVLLMRLQAEPGLLSNRADAQVAQARDIAKSIHRDLHKMHAFVRFREVGQADGRRRFAAWFEPTHRIEEPTADFFVNRFGDMDWAIVTPEVTIRYQDRTLTLHEIESQRPDADDPLEQLWTTYYANIFNPARLKPDAMRAEMPKKYWKNLPEAALIPDLIAGARARSQAMQDAAATTPRQGRRVDQTTPAPMIHRPVSLPTLHAEIHDCTRCPLHGPATQAVPGEGPRDARLMIVGEQPGDREDIEGRPFTGPAGQLFDRLADDAGLDRQASYVTNAVKHFKFVQRGKRRIHQTPNAGEVNACRWWLDRELATVDPELVLALGATALHALTGDGRGLLKRRGGVERTKDGRPLLVTLHPSYLLRLPDPAARAEATRNVTADLTKALHLLNN
ncbi:UdgX family uracil-DNA binding protein [Jannaschia donghaensis]|uniref:Type-4 uracil-DNA glycosylase n=1 Tax=Jannaschia donghaensis TaxID=420998 RepID=A0A0M6YCV4_9RHOB|nr:UdgX family uracil-DNA binding protein [Jannaschia donghaensis]CTQ48178.1 uracil-DNA glycosylase family domain protein [Jannaschia donghaensis]